VISYLSTESRYMLKVRYKYIKKGNWFDFYETLMEILCSEFKNYKNYKSNWFVARFKRLILNKWLWWTSNHWFSMAFMSCSHFHIINKGHSCPFLSLSYPNDAINFILTFLSKKYWWIWNKYEQSTYLMRAYCVGVVLSHTHVIYANWAWVE
jgi:hypothetical protein